MKGNGKGKQRQSGNKNTIKARRSLDDETRVIVQIRASEQ